MKVTLAQLEMELKKKLAPLYLVSGDEPLLKQHAFDVIRKKAQLSGFNERLRYTPDDGHFDWETLYTTLYAYSLLTEKRCIELDLRDCTPPKAAAQILEEYAAKPATDTLLLIDIGKIDDKIARSAWYKACEKHGLVITIWPISPAQLPRWIVTRAKHYDLTCTQESAQILVEYVEGNLIAAEQALEKIALLCPKEAIHPDSIRKVITDETQYTLFDFIDHLLLGQTARTLHVLQRLRLAGTEPVLILWGITRELRQMATLAAQLAQGANYEKLCQQYRIFAHRQLLVRRFLNTFSPTQCWALLSDAAHIDRLIKGAQSGDVWQCLQLFCLRVAKPTP